MPSGTRYRQELRRQLNPFGLLQKPLWERVRDRGTYWNLTTSSPLGSTPIRDQMPPAVYAAYTSILQQFTMDQASAPGGEAAVVLDDATLSATGVLDLAGQLGGTLEPATLSATGVLPIVAAAAPTLADATLSATGALDLAGQLGGTLEPATLSATAVLPILAAAAPTLDDATLQATGLLDLAGQLGGTLEPATLSATGELADAPANTGQLDVTLDDATLQATGELAGTTPVTTTRLLGGISTEVAKRTLTRRKKKPIRAVVAATLEDATLDSTLQRTAHAMVAARLEDATVSATATLDWSYVKADDDAILEMLAHIDFTARFPCAPLISAPQSHG